MKYIRMTIVCWLMLGNVCAQSMEPSVSENSHERTSDCGNDDNEQNLFIRFGDCIDFCTAWFNPLFERPVCSFPGIVSLYPRYKGYIKGCVILGAITVIARSKAMNYMITTVKEWYRDSEDTWIALYDQESRYPHCVYAGTAE